MEGHEDEFLLGRYTMCELGIDIDDMFEQLASGGRSALTDDDDATEGEDILGFGTDEAEIRGCLDRMLNEAEKEGFEPALLGQLRDLVFEFVDVWRIRIGADPPADVEPMEVKLKEGAQPFRSGVRKYNDKQRVFLRDYVEELERNGLVRRNNFSRWACAALPVLKQMVDEYRITVDYRPVNRCTVPIAGAAPNLGNVTQCVAGSYGFGQFDLFKGFWQLPLAEACQEFFSFVTEYGVFTPERVPQGACDSAVHFQLQMNKVFAAMLYKCILIWIDDLLVFAQSAEEFLVVLRKFFEVLRQRRLKLNATKCHLFSKKVEWCGKVIDGTGVAHSPERLSALQAMPPPPTAAALQHFLCAANWLRDSIVDYSRIMAPLLKKLEKVMAMRGRRKSQLAAVDLEWSSTEVDSFNAATDLLATSSTQHFAASTAELCLFTDASNTGWAIVVTQVREWLEGIPVAEQRHELVICRGGLFKGAQLNWSVIEKEAYPVVRACGDLRYLFERERGVHIYCDHANLVHIFSPGHEIKAHLRGKLQRWALQIVGVRYVIEHIKGESNLWADIVSRWGQANPAPVLTSTVVRRVGLVDEQQRDTFRRLGQQMEDRGLDLDVNDVSGAFTYGTLDVADVSNALT